MTNFGQIEAALRERSPGLGHTQNGVYHTHHGNEARGAERLDSRTTAPGLGDALFAKVQPRVLGVLFGNPRRSFYANEVIGLANSGTGAVQRELARLEAAGLVTVTRMGKQKHYQANASSPVFEELRTLILKTFGLAEVLRAALEPVSSDVRAASSSDRSRRAGTPR